MVKNKLIIIIIIIKVLIWLVLKMDIKIIFIL